MRTTRFSALPYWSPLRVIPMQGLLSTAAVGGERERAQQDRHVVMRARVGDAERDHHLRVERLDVLCSEPGTGVEADAIDADGQVRCEGADASVLVGDLVRECR